MKIKTKVITVSPPDGWSDEFGSYRWVDRKPTPDGLEVWTLEHTEYGFTAAPPNREDD